MEKEKKPRVKREYHLLSYQNADQIEVCLDECARGCGFGSTFIGAVVLPPNFEELMKAAQVIVRDSKKMSAKQREKAFHFIKDHALAYSIVSKDNKRIDEINILQAVMEAMHEAITNVRSVMEVNKILVDGDKFNPYYKDKDKDENSKDPIPHECVVEGDGTYYGIAAASILAKHAHDTWIHELVEQYPELKEYDIQNNQVLDYKGPAPPSGVHRYFFGLFEQQRTISPQQPERPNFSINEFVKDNNLIKTYEVFMKVAAN
jgi:ribonuclease HII